MLGTQFNNDISGYRSVCRRTTFENSFIYASSNFAFSCIPSYYNEVAVVSQWVITTKKGTPTNMNGFSFNTDARKLEAITDPTTEKILTRYGSQCPTYDNF